MRKALLTAVLAGLSIALVPGCNQKEMPVIPITAQEAYGLLSNDFAVLIDVRESDELKEGMAGPARWMAMSRIENDDPAWKQMMDGISKDKQLVFYCSKGGRAGRAAVKAAKLGFRAANLGGFEDWKRAGLPTKKP